MARFTKTQVLLKMAETGMVPVFYNSNADICKEVIAACYNGGARLFEFTNRGAYAHIVFEKVSAWVSEEFPDMILGTGSVIDAPTAMLYVQLDSNFIVSPIIEEGMASVLNRRKVPWMPGCGSVTEISKAESLGADVVKIFPGAEVGGPKFVAAVKGPLPWTKIMPTGGVEPTEANLTEWFKAGAFCVGMGSKLLSGELIRNKDFETIEENVKAAAEMIRMLRMKYPVTA